MLARTLLVLLGGLTWASAKGGNQISDPTNPLAVTGFPELVIIESPASTVETAANETSTEATVSVIPDTAPFKARNLLVINANLGRAQFSPLSLVSSPLAIAIDGRLDYTMEQFEAIGAALCGCSRTAPGGSSANDSSHTITFNNTYERIGNLYNLTSRDSISRQLALELRQLVATGSIGLGLHFSSLGDAKDSASSRIWSCAPTSATMRDCHQAGTITAKWCEYDLERKRIVVHAMEERQIKGTPIEGDAFEVMSVGWFSKDRDLYVQPADSSKAIITSSVDGNSSIFFDVDCVLRNAPLCPAAHSISAFSSIVPLPSDGASPFVDIRRTVNGLYIATTAHLLEVVDIDALTSTAHPIPPTGVAIVTCPAGHLDTVHNTTVIALAKEWLPSAKTSTCPFAKS